MYTRLLVVSGLVAAASAFAPAGPAHGLHRAGAARAGVSTRGPSVLSLKAAWDPAVDKDFLIAPSILSADFAKLGQEVDNMLAAGADVVHFDVMDNHYVPNLTIGPGVCKALRDHGVTAPIDVHLMVSPVDRIVGDFIDAGASYITFHPEATNHIDRSLAMIKQGGCKAGLVINPATSLDVCKHVMDKIDIILLMSVNPGFGGQKFIPAVLDKARIARKMIDESGYDIRLEIDGGVTVDNIASVAEAGVDMFVAGSAILKEPRTLEAYTATINTMRKNLAASKATSPFAKVGK
mmetsp:Transcript_32342/g.47184  ORF Transcript_32342/g.47184 Transcript_32342/m.47184 type:complete len:293 (+) Transcript_32342:23-901(+)